MIHAGAVFTEALAPTTTLADFRATNTPVTADPTERNPVRLIIPSIGMDAPVEGVGINEKGEMDVPDGSTDTVGWYKGGPQPGAIGSTVFAAHVYAAFSDLRYVKPGSDIYVLTKDGSKLHFVVDDSRVYKLGELSPKILFGRHDAQRLNLITCAGSPTADGSTYDHRLVVYTRFVGIEA